jgi:hypothetical protein
MGQEIGCKFAIADKPCAIRNGASATVQVAGSDHAGVADKIRHFFHFFRMQISTIG